MKKKINCDDCKKCGENICGNDTEFLRCFESKIKEGVKNDRNI